MSFQDNLVKGARIYRFGDCAALSWTGVDNSNHYITPEVAEALGNLLLDYAEDCRVHPFTTSRLGTQIIEADGAVKKEGGGSN